MPKKVTWFKNGVMFLQTQHPSSKLTFEEHQKTNATPVKNFVLTEAKDISHLDTKLCHNLENVGQ